MLTGFAALIEMIYARQYGSVGDTNGALPRPDARHRERRAVAGRGVPSPRSASWRSRPCAGASPAVWGAVQGEIEATMTFKEPNAAIPEGGQAAARQANRGEP